MRQPNIFPFPLAKRRDLVPRLAARCAELSPAAAEAHLSRQVDLQASVMARRGIRPDRIPVECGALEAAVRAALWHAVLSPKGVA